MGTDSDSRHPRCAICRLIERSEESRVHHTRRVLHAHHCNNPSAGAVGGGGIDQPTCQTGSSRLGELGDLQMRCRRLMAKWSSRRTCHLSRIRVRIRTFLQVSLSPTLGAELRSCSCSLYARWILEKRWILEMYSSPQSQELAISLPNAPYNVCVAHPRVLPRLFRSFLAVAHHARLSSVLSAVCHPDSPPRARAGGVRSPASDPSDRLGDLSTAGSLAAARAVAGD